MDVFQVDRRRGPTERACKCCRAHRELRSRAETSAAGLQRQVVKLCRGTEFAGLFLPRKFQALEALEDDVIVHGVFKGGVNGATSLAVAHRLDDVINSQHVTTCARLCNCYALCTTWYGLRTLAGAHP